MHAVSPQLDLPGLLHNPSSAWVVRRGAVDLFLVHIVEGRTAGARMPVGRVEAGGIVFGMQESSTRYGLLAQPRPDAEWDSICFESTTDAQIETWIETLMPALGSMRSPEATGFEPLQPLELQEGQWTGSREALTWIEHLSGRSYMLGSPVLTPVNGTTPFPLTAQLWLAPERAARLRRVEPDARSRAAGLAEFHSRLVEALVELSKREESRFTARLEARRQSDVASYRTAQRALAAVLEENDTAAPSFGTDPLLNAARAAGRCLGLTIVAPPPARRTSTRDPIEAIARATSLRVRRVSLRNKWYREAGGPLVAYLAESGQPVALLPDGPSSYKLWDPVAGSERRVTAAVAGGLSLHAYCFYRPLPAIKLTFGTLIAFGLRGIKRDAALVLLTGALAGLVGLIPPVVTGFLFDSVIPATDRVQLAQVFGILFVAALSTWLLTTVQGFALLRIEGRMDSSLQAALWDRLVSLPATFFRNYNAGDLASRSLAISSIRQVLTGAALSAVLAGVFSILSLILLFYYGPSLALKVTALVAISFLVTVCSALLQIRIQRRIIELGGKVAGLLPQLLGGVSKLRVAAAEERAFARWALKFAEQKRLVVRSRRISIGLAIFFPSFQTATMMALFYLVIRSGGSGMTTGAFLAFQTAFLQVLAGASQIGSTLVSVLGIVPLYERARPILETLPEVSTNKSDPGAITGDIELNHVAFRYRTDLPPVLKDVSFRVRAGQFVAIVGGTGSGKSTIFRLLLGFETPESGSIFFDGQDLSTLDVQAVRRQAGVVLQQSGVLGGDLFSNIVGNSPLTLDDAWEAARMAGIEEDIRNMPMGMFTVIPEGGLGLSGGQRQRLQIARAIVNRPRLLLFDEATSALDNRTQATVTDSLARLNVTRIVIAHRLTTVRHADRILVLNNGVVEESGTYDELVARDGFFAALAKRQLT